MTRYYIERRQCEYCREDLHEYEQYGNVFLMPHICLEKIKLKREKQIMPDISMCQDKDCPSSKNCFRFMAIPYPYQQSYADFQRKKNAKKCSNFMDRE